MFHNLDDESDEEESHHKFNKEGLRHQFAIIIAAIGWAQLMQVVFAFSWDLAFFCR